MLDHGGHGAHSSLCMAVSVHLPNNYFNDPCSPDRKLKAGRGDPGPSGLGLNLNLGTVEPMPLVALPLSLGIRLGPPGARLALLPEVSRC